MELQKAYLALGSNTSPRREHILNAINLLKNRFPEGFRISSLYLTRAFRNNKQDAYYNCCACFETDISPEELLKTILAFEKQIGRTRNGIKWSSRIIDIDIVLYGATIIESSNLTIPHYDLNQRDFFIIPLTELDQQLTNPKSNQLLSQILKAIPEDLLTYPRKETADLKQ